MEHLERVAYFDSMGFRFEPVPYYIVEDPLCKKHKDYLATDGPAVVLYVHSYVPPYILKDTILDNAEDLSVWISLSLIQFTLRWGERAERLVNQAGVNALILLIDPETVEREVATTVAETAQAAR